jgi:hypothetical protein
MIPKRMSRLAMTALTVIVKTQNIYFE